MKESYDIMKILSIEEAKTYSKGNAVIITGVTGQDGSFMADYLLKNTNYQVFGGARRLSVSNHENIEHLDGHPNFHLINFDLTDAHSISLIISQLNPKYFINFAAQSFVKSSWDFPAQTWDTNTKSIIHILEAIRLHSPLCRFYNAGSSEEFGNVVYTPQDENHPLRPRSPYGASKASSRQLVKVYRESYNMYAIQGWLFNHEGTRRGEEFVTRKITKAVAKISQSMKLGYPYKVLELGNLDVSRDWTDAEDCVKAVWKMLNQEQYNMAKFLPYELKSLQIQDVDAYTLKNDIVPYLKEYIVASGESHTVREFVEKAFIAAGITGYWQGSGTDEVYLSNEKHETLVKINPAFYRPAEVDKLLGNFTDIKEDLKWTPNTSFDELVKKMVVRDIQLEEK